MQSPTKFRAVVIGAGLAFLILLQLLTNYPSFVEDYYSTGLYPFLTLFISSLSGAFHFSLSESALWFFVLIVLPVFVSRIISKKMSIARALLNMATTISVTVIVFYIFWGMNYFRMPLSAKLQLDQVPLDIDAFDSTFVDIISKANELNISYSIADLEHINAKIDSSYVPVLQELGIKPVPGTKVVKSFLANWLLNTTATSGWFSPFFHEVHYNSDLLVIELPFVLAHEKAHRMGYTSEAEANFLAYLVCLNSPEPLLRYSGYFSALGYFLQTSKKRTETHKKFVAMIAESVKLDMVAVLERWKSHLGFISDLSARSYDLYLRTNQVTGGRSNYSRVVDLIIKYRSKKLSSRTPKESTPDLHQPLP